MQTLGDGSWVISASDLGIYAGCPWRLARVADEKLGKGIHVPALDDPMMVLVARLGLEHEARQWDILRRELRDVIEISYDRANSEDAALWRSSIMRAASQTHEALRSSTKAIFQGVLYQEEIPHPELKVGFQGFADFLVKAGDVWEVWDSKLARKAKDAALVQVSAYVDQLRQIGIPTSDTVRLILGDGSHSVHQASDHLGEYLSLREKVLALMVERSADPHPVPWNDSRYMACGTKGCPACSEQIPLHDDLFLIAGIKKSQREKLLVAGFAYLSDFANASRDEVRRNTSGIGRDTLAGLHLQASLQHATRSHPDSPPAWEVVSRSVLASIPRPSPGDIFFDFEGDPTYQEWDIRPREGQPDTFGIEYLFGLWGEGLGTCAEDPHFLGLWAETFEKEKQALESFCALISDRLEKFPDLHIYHYASYERTRLAVLVKRHQVAGDCVEKLLDGVLVDLFSVVTKGIKVGLPSYSLKALEALYFPPETRTGIAGGGESVVAFSDYLKAKDDGDELRARELKDSIVHYNRIDCFSAQALRDWLLNDVLAASPSATD